MSVELITYPSRTKLVEALVKFSQDDAVEAVDVIDLGLTLRLRFAEGAALDPEEVPESGEDEPSGAPDPSPVPEADANADEPEAEEDDETEYLTWDDVQALDRAGLRELVAEYNLDIKIADTGGLPTAKVAEALGLSEDD